MHTSLTCSATGESYAVDQLQNLSRAGKPLLAGYDLEALRDSFTPQVVRRRNIRSMWKFWEVMPVQTPDQAVSLGEGCTPLLPCRRRGPFEAFEHLFIKDEAFKAGTGAEAARLSAAAAADAHAAMQLLA